MKATLALLVVAGVLVWAFFQDTTSVPKTEIGLSVPEVVLTGSAEKGSEPKSPPAPAVTQPTPEVPPLQPEPGKKENTAEAPLPGGENETVVSKKADRLPTATNTDSTEGSAHHTEEGIDAPKQTIYLH